MQGYQRGNQIQQAFTQRGLGTSGLAQYGNIQNRQAMGQSINQLAGQNAEVARAAMDASRGISQNLQNTLMKARLQSDAQNVENDQMLYQQQMGEQDANYQRALEYMNVLGVDPTSEQGKAVLSQLFAGQLPAELQAQLESAANAPVDLLDGGVKRNLGSIAKYGTSMQEFYADLFRLNKGEGAKNNKAVTDFTNQILSFLPGGAGVLNLFGAGNATRYSYNIAGKDIKAKSAADAEKQISSIYGNKQYMTADNTGQIKVFVDTTSGRVTFVDQRTGTQSKTYNDAVTKLTGK